ncbi:hypothetical protein D7B24_000227 [Verticillium nonalfalfae]|uniref:BZIP domain-containing protein n=1 Tax=Verticillium nonalfalfae TaxID=1051616 RepID=A0A3M9YJA6_9PEZI|nr:uncharacterized protein D7B24_000227 [Verticillium nonalfalfae]RNJ60032.1 hypothetical protein D7B24_000227 [Verticillium nonalfalfae]
MKRTRGASPDADDIHLRRERGRKAQQAFRQRQITAINELRASNEAMQAAIAKVSQVASKLGSAELDRAVRDAVSIAGLERQAPVSLDAGKAPSPPPPGPSSEPQFPSTHAPSSSSQQSESAFPPEVAPSQSQCTPHLTVSQPAASLLASRTPVPPSHLSPPSVPLDTPADGPLPAYASGRMSPGFGYGLWLAPAASRQRDPPIDIAPYLAIDKTSFASVVYWTGMMWGTRLLEAAMRGDSAEAEETCRFSFGALRDMGGSDEQILHGMRARLSFRRRGYVEADHPGYDPDKGARVQALMLSHSTAKGLRLDKFLRPAAVELAFRRRLGPEYAVIEQGLKGLGSAEEVMRVRALVQLMVKTSRCLGDGPRWDIDRVATILETWAAGNSDSPRS